MKKLYDKVTYQYNKKKQIYLVQFTIRKTLEKTRFLEDLFCKTKGQRALQSGPNRGVAYTQLKI
jgi:hypothetical protein